MHQTTSREEILLNKCSSVNMITAYQMLWIFKVALKFGQSPCTIVQGLQPNFVKND